MSGIDNNMDLNRTQIRLDDYLTTTSPKGLQQQPAVYKQKGMFSNDEGIENKANNKKKKPEKLVLNTYKFKKYDHQIDSPLRQRTTDKKSNLNISGLVTPTQGSTENIPVFGQNQIQFADKVGMLSRQQTFENDVDLINQRMADEDLILPTTIGRCLEVESDRSRDDQSPDGQSPDERSPDDGRGSPVNEFKMDYNFSLTAPIAKKKKPGPKLTINIYNTHYDILIQNVGKICNFKSRMADPGLNVNPYAQHEPYQIQQATKGVEEEFDIVWFDLAITPDILAKLKPYQRVSQWPGIQVIAHKNKLGKNLMLMRKEFAEEYDFFPETYMLPYEINEFKNQFPLREDRDKIKHNKKKLQQNLLDPANLSKNSNGTKFDPANLSVPTQKRQFDPASISKSSNVSKFDPAFLSKNSQGQKYFDPATLSKISAHTTASSNQVDQLLPIRPKKAPVFIIKPECLSQGKGIFLTSNYDDIHPHDHVVAQKYIGRPFLIDKLKFDLRIYVMLYGINPMRIFVYEEGLARFATVPYEEPKNANMRNMFMHLTNYAINKESSDYKQNENAEGSGKSHKRGLKQIYKTIESKGLDVEKLKGGIDDLIIKTMITAQPSMWHIYRSCQPDDIENQLCFQILGFDVMIDEDLKPWLIEVNHAPSLATESAFDLTVKESLVKDTINLLNLSVKRKSKYTDNMKIQFQQRILTGKNKKLSQEEKEIKRVEIDNQRDIIEERLKGGYKQIYPIPNDDENFTSKEKTQKYDKMLEISKELYEYFTNGKKGKDGSNLRMLREQQELLNKDKRPAWRSTGVSNMPSYEKPSKYQLNNNVKSKVYTGLNDKYPKQTISEKINEEQLQNLIKDNKQELEIDENGNILLDQLIKNRQPKSDEEGNELTLYQHILLQAKINKQDTSHIDLDKIQDYEQQYNKNQRLHNMSAITQQRVSPKNINLNLSTNNQSQLSSKFNFYLTKNNNQNLLVKSKESTQENFNNFKTTLHVPGQPRKQQLNTTRQPPHLQQNQIAEQKNKQTINDILDQVIAQNTFDKRNNKNRTDMSIADQITQVLTRNQISLTQTQPSPDHNSQQNSILSQKLQGISGMGFVNSQSQISQYAQNAALSPMQNSSIKAHKIQEPNGQQQQPLQIISGKFVQLVNPKNVSFSSKDGSSFFNQAEKQSQQQVGNLRAYSKLLPNLQYPQQVVEKKIQPKTKSLNDDKRMVYNISSEQNGNGEGKRGTINFENIILNNNINPVHKTQNTPQVFQQRALNQRDLPQQPNPNSLDLLKQIEKSQDLINQQLNHMHKLDSKIHASPIVNKNFQNQIIAQQLMSSTENKNILQKAKMSPPHSRNNASRVEMYNSKLNGTQQISLNNQIALKNNLSPGFGEMRTTSRRNKAILDQRTRGVNAEQLTNKDGFNIKQLQQQSAANIQNALFPASAVNGPNEYFHAQQIISDYDPKQPMSPQPHHRKFVSYMNEKNGTKSNLKRNEDYGQNQNIQVIQRSSSQLQQPNGLKSACKQQESPNRQAYLKQQVQSLGINLITTALQPSSNHFSQNKRSLQL